MNSLPLQIGDEAPDFHITDASGGFVHLHTLCESGPVLMLFLRTPG